MTPEKIQDVIRIYRAKLEDLQIEKNSYPHDEFLDNRRNGLGHCNAMLDKIEGFIKEGRTDKVYRWLGFIQGVLWSQRIYTLNSLMSHNRPDPKP